MRSGVMFTLYTLASPALPIVSFAWEIRRECLGEIWELNAWAGVWLGSGRGNAAIVNELVV